MFDGEIISSFANMVACGDLDNTADTKPSSFLTLSSDSVRVPNEAIYLVDSRKGRSGSILIDLELQSQF